MLTEDSVVRSVNAGVDARPSAYEVCLDEYGESRGGVLQNDKHSQERAVSKNYPPWSGCRSGCRDIKARAIVAVAVLTFPPTWRD